MRSSNQYVDSETWLSDDVSMGYGNSLRGRTYEIVHETLTGSPSSLHDIQSPDEWLSGEAKLDVCGDAESILFQVHDRLGQIPSTGDGSLQQHATLTPPPDLVHT